MAPDQDRHERHVPRRAVRRMRPYTARSLLADRAIDAVMRVVERAPVRLLLLALLLAVVADLIWRVLAVAGMCQ
jgi:hypothetical protein